VFAIARANKKQTNKQDVKEIDHQRIGGELI
jgi:hypothetical protein